MILLFFIPIIIFSLIIPKGESTFSKYSSIIFPLGCFKSNSILKKYSISDNIRIYCSFSSSIKLSFKILNFFNNFFIFLIEIFENDLFITNAISKNIFCIIRSLFFEKLFSSILYSSKKLTT